MARRRRTVYYFAKRAGVPEEFALELLIESGIKVKRTGDIIPKAQMYKAEIALDLAKPPKSIIRVPPIATSPSIPNRQTEKIIKETTTHSGESHVETKIAKKRGKDALPIAGRRQPLFYLNYDQVERIHYILVEDFKTSRDPIDPPGIKDQNLLHSALDRCLTSLGKDLKYPTPPMAAAALLHSLIHNYPFHNGNKRTGLVSTLSFLDMNGWSLRSDQDVLFDFILNIGAHNLKLSYPSLPGSDGEVYEIAQFVHKNSGRANTAPKRLKFHELRSILQQYDCQFGTVTRGCAINIRCGDHKTQIYYGGDGKEVEIQTINKLRQNLCLDEIHGYDTDVFYNAEEKLPTFITKYRKTLDRLAKV